MTSPDLPVLYESGEVLCLKSYDQGYSPNMEDDNYDDCFVQCAQPVHDTPGVPGSAATACG